MQNLAELRAREEELAGEWQWLVDALNTMARASELSKATRWLSG